MNFALLMGSLDEAFSSQLKCHFYIDSINASASRSVIFRDSQAQTYK